MPSCTTEKIQTKPAELSDDGQASGPEAVPDEGRVRVVTETKARRRRARPAGGIVVNVVVHVDLWATFAAPLLNAMFRGTPEGQERCGDPAPIRTIVVLALVAVGAGVLSVLTR